MRITAKPEYIEYYRNQLRELLTGYGDVFEVWFDGANGGDGWYGGANETRTIDRNTYYDWPGTWQVVRELQPGAVMFSDGGPDVRWVGNEKGFAGETNWSLLKRADFAPGRPTARRSTSGRRRDPWLRPRLTCRSARGGVTTRPRIRWSGPCRNCSISIMRR